MKITSRQKKILANHLSRYLKYFEQEPSEKNFWDEILNITALIEIKNELLKGK